MPGNYPLGEQDNDRIRFNESTQIWERGAGGEAGGAGRIYEPWAGSDLTVDTTGFFINWYTPQTATATAAALDQTIELVMPDSGSVARVEVYSEKALANLTMRVFVDGVAVEVRTQLVAAATGVAFDFEGAAFNAGGRVGLWVALTAGSVAENELNLGMLIALDGNV